MRILIVGSGAREHALSKSLAKSPSRPTLYCCASHINPGIKALTQAYWVGDIRCVQLVVAEACQWQIELAIIGPEAPLEQGLADALEAAGIPTVGPKKRLAQLETSKSFTRELLAKYQISGSPRFQTFHQLTGVMAFLNQLGEGGYVIKADGLMGGKGVKVAGDHLRSFQEAYQFCEALSRLGQPFVIEEKLVGQEFSLMCFCDGKQLIPMPLVQDHKRAFVNDLGPNTGGMGSYSDANHRLPFLTPDDVASAQKINSYVLQALTLECGETYCGILYGSFMATAHGIKLIEYNARFGDPEALNVLSILDSDLVELCQALVTGTLQTEQVHFQPLATVCKYAVPMGYPDTPLLNARIDISQVQDKEHLYYAAVVDAAGELRTTSSRAMAVVGIAPTLLEAENRAETLICQIQGPLYHREDIGKASLINRRINMMQQLRPTETVTL